MLTISRIGSIFPGMQGWSEVNSLKQSVPWRRPQDDLSLLSNSGSFTISWKWLFSEQDDLMALWGNFG